MSAAVCGAQAAVLVGGLIAGALRGDQLYVASILVAVPAAVVCIQLLGSLEVGQPQTPRRSEPSPTELGSDAETTELGSGAQTTGGCASPPTEPARGAETKEAQHDGGLASPATRAVDTPFTSDVAPAAAPAATAPAGSAHGGGLVRVLGMRYFWAVAFAPFVQGAAIGATFQIYAPMLLKLVHGWEEGEVARMFQLGGLAALIAHATVTPWLSSRPWRVRAVQAIHSANALLLVAYGHVGRHSAPLALALPVILFVGTAVSLGIVNYMVALFARTVVPDSLSALTGLTRCLFTLGFATLPAAYATMVAAGQLMAPCIIGAALFGASALLMQAATTLPAPSTAPTATARADGAAAPSAAEVSCVVLGGEVTDSRTMRTDLSTK